MGANREMDHISYFIVHSDDCHIQRNRSLVDAYYRQKRDIDTLQNLGADDRLISKIFLVEGWLISAIGAGSGLILGVILCYLQQEYGILKLGSSEGVFITDAYPVKLELLDTLAVTAIVLILGFVTAWYPAKFLRKDF